MTASPRQHSPGRAFKRLVDLMRTLRSPHGCPWDREQTLATLRPFVIEEAYEVVDAIDRGDLEALRDEIGDLIFEGVFLAQLTAEDGFFDVGDALEAIIAKLVRRHPHVFTRRADGALVRRQRVISSDEVKGQWERIKTTERAGAPAGPLDDVPRAMPALMRAQKLGSRAARARFDWPDPRGVLRKIDEELAELRAAIDGSAPDAVEEELGDLLFSVVNLARKLGVDAELALNAANSKFVHRFDEMIRVLRADGHDPADATLDVMEAAWQRTKEVPGSPKRVISGRPASAGPDGTSGPSTSG